MAKVLGLTNTTIRGKIGNTVFYTRKAQPLARMYQPVVSNPQTELQLRQRSKMTQSVAINRQIREGLKSMVGTGTGKYEYQGVQKIIMNSAIVKQSQAPTNKLTGDQLASILSGLNLKNVMDAVGNNYSREKLNVFDPGVTLGASTITANGTVQLLSGVLLGSTSTQGLVWASFTQGVTNSSYAFGCDYELGNKLYFISIIPAATVANGQALPSIQITELDLQPANITGVTFTGVRTRGGVFCNTTNVKDVIGLCGSGWNYYYILARPTSIVYCGTGLSVSGLINGSYQIATLYNLCYLVGTANTSNDLGIQVLKGYSYNSYTSHDAIEE